MSLQSIPVPLHPRQKTSMECIVPLRSCSDQLPSPEPGVIFLLVEYLPSSETLHEGEQVMELVKKLRKLVT